MVVSEQTVCMRIRHNVCPVQQHQRLVPIDPHSTHAATYWMQTLLRLYAAVEGPAQAAAFAWLGRFYREVASDTARARKCLQKALALDPTQADAGG